MKINRFEITLDQMITAEMTLKYAGPSPFRLGNVSTALVRAGAPVEATYRGADRLIQRWRKDGKLRQPKRGLWEFASDGSHAAASMQTAESPMPADGGKATAP